MLGRRGVGARLLHGGHVRLSCRWLIGLRLRGSIAVPSSWLRGRRLLVHGS